MNKKLSLAEALQEASGKKKESSKEGLSKNLSSITQKEKNIVSDHSSPEVHRQLNRIRKKIISGHFDLEVSRQLKQIALDHDTTLQVLLTEALNDLFIKYGAKPIA